MSVKWLRKIKLSVKRKFRQLFTRSTNKNGAFPFLMFPRNRVIDEVVVLIFQPFLKS